MPAHILLVEDNDLLRLSLSFNLSAAGYRVSTAVSAEDALALVEQDPPELLLLDIGLPGMDGLDALPRFRQKITAPVIFLTGRRRQLDELLGLELGADDYITKPFDESILLARIKAVLRRARQQPAAPPDPQLVVGDIMIDPETHTVTRAGRLVELSPREFALLQALAEGGGKVLSVEELLNHVWGPEFEGQSQVVYVHIRWLREKLETNPNKPERILTVRGIGYRLVPGGEV